MEGKGWTGKGAICPVEGKGVEMDGKDRGEGNGMGGNGRKRSGE